MAKKNKVPKKIAGIKLPKPLRRAVRDLAASESGRAALVEALAAAGAALAAPQAPPGAKNRKLAAGQALEPAVRAFTEALRRGQPEEAPTPVAPPPSALTH